MLNQKLKKKIISLIVCLLTLAAFAGSASAGVIGGCSLTGYTFMGGNSAYTCMPSGTNPKDYFTASSLNYDYSGSNMWGYGWVKFTDIETTAVFEAHVVFELLGVGAMGSSPASEASPAILYIYDPGEVDAADLGDDASLRSTLRDTLDAATPLATLTMTSDGVYSLEITDLYNAWVANEEDNHGLIFVAPDEGTASQYASFGHATGAVPYISTESVMTPEPLTATLLAAGGLGILRRRNRR